MKTRRRALGQHFLRDARLLEKIARTIDPQPADVVIEIGPGKGALTRALSPLAGKVVAVEMDRILAEALDADKPENVTVVEGDALVVSFERLITEIAGAGARPPVKIIGNLPYAISGPFLARVWEKRRLFSRASFLIQREVAERIAAGPGSKEFAPLSIMLQVYFDVKILFRVAPGSFVPPPKVDSAVVSLVRRETPLIALADEAGFRKFLGSAFSQRRKTLLNNLAAMDVPAEKGRAALASLGLVRTVRPEQVAIAAWAGLFAALRPADSPSLSRK
ncbi:MAG: 16S rRNA (adenine(1518)-N(6)/adenine(1519)-N(6))-dimethyltransferase RsmA [Candidatus Aminicenantes bacterium]|nr:16S rRNA (adenine(1518)-N(6)/adenine(1519)-N(6))-dimethyltransferase RsmA [Candidatus Aminicenantes bacterium]